MAQARCPYCGRWYAVHPRLWGRQKTCGRAVCRAKHKAALNQKWWKEHPVKRHERYERVKARRREQKYWDKRRARQPDYVKRNREQTRERMRLLRAKRREAAQIGYVNAPNREQINNFFRLMDSRCNRKSAIVSTNLGFQEWGGFLGNGPLTAALLSRLLQKCHVLPFPTTAVNLREPKLKLPTSAPIPEILKSS